MTANKVLREVIKLLEDAKIEEYIKSQYAEGETIDMNEYDTSHILFSFTKDDGTSMP